MNAQNIYNLIVAKQGSTSHGVTREVGLALLITTGVLLLSMFTGPAEFNDQIVVFGLGMAIIAVLKLGRHTFDEYKNERSAYLWLTLPATQIEKWLGSFITTFLLVPIVYLVVIFASTLLANLVVGILGFGHSMPIFNLFSAESLALLKSYWFVHPLFFFAAIYFKKHPLMKMFATLSLLLIVWLVFTGYTIHWLFGDLLTNVENNVSSHMETHQVIELFGMFEISDHGVEFNPNLLTKVVAKTLFYGYFIFFWAMSYLRLRELEI